MEGNNTSSDNKSQVVSWLPWQWNDYCLIQDTIAEIQGPQFSNVILSCDYCRRIPLNGGCCQSYIHGLMISGHGKYGNPRIPGIRARNNLAEMIPVESKYHLYELAMAQDHPNRDDTLQQYIGALSQRQLSDIVQFMKIQLVEMSIHHYGYQFVLELLNHATKLYVQIPIVEGLLGGIVTLMQNFRGVYIISRCLRKFSDEVNKLLCDEIGAHIHTIAKDQVGYMQVIRLVRNPKTRYGYHILMQISENALALAEDQYGNYVIQKVLDMNISHVTTCILTRLKGYYSLLSCSRYGSHVVEKCLDIQDVEQAKEIIIELIRSPDISTLLLDSFGNFVIQHAWEVSKNWEDIHEELALSIQKHASELKHDLHGKNVLNKLKDSWRRRCLHARS